MNWIKIFVVTLILTNQMQAQNKEVKNWHLLDYETDGYRGISLQKAYDLLKGKKSEKVIVAIIDSGIDTAHNDIPIWKNPKEVPNNGKDDDGNGLVDDFYGWNYLGASNGENLAISINDYWRTYHRFLSKFENIDTAKLTKDEKHIYKEWLRAKNYLDAKYEDANANYKLVKTNYDKTVDADSVVRKLLNKNVFMVDDITDANKDEYAFTIWNKIFAGRKFTNEEYLKQYKNYITEMEDALLQKREAPVDERAKLLKDDSYDITKIHYGNHNLQTHSGYHGTSVSSIVGALRNNNLGIDGIADNVEIMMIRGILGKDEFDKDVALSIRYAVDHGAKVINMSFGKYISPDKRWVDEAIQYALDHDVILVHATGNDGENIDLNFNYPHAFSIEGKRFPNFINVSASGDKHTGGLVPFFTNYGQKMVDIFAPGVAVNCGIVGGGVQYASGTSMASPVVAGVAALLRSYFPKLTAAQIVDIILKNGVVIKEKVKLPNAEEDIKFNFLSKTGAIVNAYLAVKAAMLMK